MMYDPPVSPSYRILLNPTTATSVPCRTFGNEGEQMEILGFIANAVCALTMGLGIGLERQFRQHPAGLRTNALVCVGAALFVSLTRLMGDNASPTRIASYIVSGIGFLCGGGILRGGVKVKGVNNAAPPWCSAAGGALAGGGLPPVCP